MKTFTKLHKQEIDSYFGNIPHHIRTFHFKGTTLFYVEYEDFLSEAHVTEDLSRLLEGKAQVNVKRNLSDKMFGELLKRHGHFAGQHELCELMASYEPC